MKTPQSERRNPGIKALPFFKIVQQFAFLHDLPFFLYTDQIKVIHYYKESLKSAGGKYNESNN